MKRAIAGILVLLCGTSACTSTFLAGKDGKGYFLGSTSDAAYQRFCASGDLLSVLADTLLPQEIRDKLFRATCSEERSRAAVKELYGQMTPEQRKDLRTAFKRQGYDINYIPC